ncbi:MAG: transposase family protein [Gallionella sp.]|nr:transposase family protein [Gallionella sp.]MDP1941216.1 transposase family protein [Gallionella sp.]
MTPYAQLPTNKPEEFMRMVGLSKEDFQHLNKKLCAYIDAQKALHPLTRRGRKDSKLALEDRLLLTLYYLRHYPILINLAVVFGISESYCHKVYARTVRLLAKVEKLPNRKVLLEDPAATLAIDVSEQPIERPVKGQKAYYSGKKKRHTIKAQLVICALTLTILSVVLGKGQQHDFSVFKDSRLLLHPDARLLADSGYQGMHQHHQNSTLPIKKKKGQPLSTEDKAHNKALSKQRVFIEHVNRRCKIFRIIKDVYRGKHKNYSLTWNVVAALVNLRYGCI